MELIIHVVQPPNGGYYSGPTDEFTREELRSVPDFVQEIWYWYTGGGWDGQGYMLLRSGDEYAIGSLSHCSCYGPLEDVGGYEEKGFVEFEKLYSNCTKDYLRDIQPLLDAARQ